MSEGCKSCVYPILGSLQLIVYIGFKCSNLTFEFSILGLESFDICLNSSKFAFKCGFKVVEFVQKALLYSVNLVAHLLLHVLNLCVGGINLRLEVSSGSLQSRDIAFKFVIHIFQIINRTVNGSYLLIDGVDVCLDNVKTSLDLLYFNVDSIYLCLKIVLCSLNGCSNLCTDLSVVLGDSILNSFLVGCSEVALCLCKGCFECINLLLKCFVALGNLSRKCGNLTVYLHLLVVTFGKNTIHPIFHRDLTGCDGCLDSIGVGRLYFSFGCSNSLGVGIGNLFNLGCNVGIHTSNGGSDVVGNLLAKPLLQCGDALLGALYQGIDLRNGGLGSLILFEGREGCACPILYSCNLIIDVLLQVGNLLAKFRILCL